MAIAKADALGSTVQSLAITTSSTSSCTSLLSRELCASELSFQCAWSTIDFSDRPQWPWTCGRQPNQKLVQFFPTNERLSLLLSIIMGLQHALVMMVGLVFAPVAVAALAPPGTTVPQCMHLVSRRFHDT